MFFKVIPWTTATKWRTNTHQTVNCNYNKSSFWIYMDSSFPGYTCHCCSFLEACVHAVNPSPGSIFTATLSPEWRHEKTNKQNFPNGEALLHLMERETQHFCLSDTIFIFSPEKVPLFCAWNSDLAFVNWRTFLLSHLTITQADNVTLASRVHLSTWIQLLKIPS